MDEIFGDILGGIFFQILLSLISGTGLILAWLVTLGQHRAEPETSFILGLIFWLALIAVLLLHPPARHAVAAVLHLGA